MAIFDAIVIATDSQEVIQLCESLGAPGVLTDPAHPSGTDRVAEVMDRPEFQDFPIILNIQGDEPLVEEEHLASAVRLIRDEEWELATCATPLRTQAALHDPSTVKVVRTQEGGALYFSRAPVPHRRDGSPTSEELGRPPYLRHLGIYAYRREALAAWVRLPPSPLEELERLEQLRPLEAGLSMGVAVVDSAEPGVDTEADVTRMEEAFAHASELITSTDES